MESLGRDAASGAAEASVAPLLVEAAARLLVTEGGAALSVKRVTAEVGVSTMAIYTHFGGMKQLVRAVVAEGFARLAEHLQHVPISDDPVEDITGLGAAYLAHAQANPELYVVMFGAGSLGGYRLADDELDHGRYVFGMLADAVSRAMAAGDLREGDPIIAAAQLWIAIHGYAMLELAGYFDLARPDIATERKPAEQVLAPVLGAILVGLGAKPRPD